MNNNSFWRKLHRWTALILAGFVCFYCITGLMLNHRQMFGYFQDRQKSVERVEIQDHTPLQSFIDTYKQQINRNDDPKVIRIRKGGNIEFLYGSHGRTTYIIDPALSTMTRIDKVDNQPWYWLNGLHKAYKTSNFWLLLTDLVSLMILFLTISGLILFQYTRRDFMLLAGGLLMMMLGVTLA